MALVILYLHLQDKNWWSHTSTSLLFRFFTFFNVFFNSKTWLFTLLSPARRKRAGKRCFCLSVCLSVRPSRTYRITPEPESLACPNSEWRSPTSDATRTPVSRSKGDRSRSPGPLAKLWCWHIWAAYLPTATYRITMVGVFLGHFCINLCQTRTQNSNKGPQHCNGANFGKSLSKSRILSP